MLWCSRSSNDPPLIAIISMLEQPANLVEPPPKEGAKQLQLAGPEDQQALH
jgi:hypothetical protein